MKNNNNNLKKRLVFNMKIKEKENADLNINRKYHVINNILNNVHQIFLLLQPIINRMIELKDTKMLNNIENLKKTALLFGEISELCKEIENNNSSKETIIKMGAISYFT